MRGADREVGAYSTLEGAIPPRYPDDPTSGRYHSETPSGRARAGPASLYELAVRHMVETSHLLLKENQLTTDDVDFFIFHQANIRIIDYCAKVLGVPPHKTWNNLDKAGFNAK